MHEIINEPCSRSRDFPQTDRLQYLRSIHLPDDEFVRGLPPDIDELRRADRTRRVS